MREREGPPKVLPWRFTEREFRRVWKMLNPDLADADLRLPSTLYGRPVEIIEEEALGRLC